MWCHLTIVLICISVMVSDVEHLFMHYLANGMSSVLDYLLSLLIFKNCFFSFVEEFWKLFGYAGYKSFVGSVICKFILLTVSFKELKFFILMTSNLSIFFTWDNLLVCLRTLWLTLGHLDFLLKVLLFYILYLYIQSMNWLLMDEIYITQNSPF